MERDKKEVVLITGASSGIGKSTANFLREEGFIVYAASRRIDRMEDLKAKGIKVLGLDLTNEDSITGCVDHVISETGVIDVLINNAGYGFFGSLEDVPLSEAKRQFEVNLFGAGRLMQLILPHMRKQGAGKIINITSTGGIYATPFGGWYQSTKFALEGLSDALRMDVARFGIDVIIIEPGAVESEWTSIALDHLLKVSSMPYAKAAEKVVKSMEKSYAHASDPVVIARVIKKAIDSKKPRTRYAAGRYAKPTLLLRSLVTDRQLDRFFLKMLGIYGKDSD